MANYYPQMNYDPMNPTAVNNNLPYNPQQNPAQYGPMRGNTVRNTFKPNISGNRIKPFNQMPGTQTNIYVSGFPSPWGSFELRNVFKKYGSVTELNVITKETTEQNRGVAFVHFSKNLDANKAIEDLQVNIPEGCIGPLTVRFANTNRNVSTSAVRTMRVNISRFNPAGYSLESTTNLYASQLPVAITEEEIRKVFSPYGVIKSMRKTASNDKGSVAFVHFETPEDAIKAVAEIDGKILDEKSGAASVRFANINKTNIPAWFTVENLRTMQTTCNIYVSQIPIDWDEEKLRGKFSPFGTINEIKLLSKNDGNLKVAFLHFENSTSACKAISNVNDKPISADSDHCLVATFARIDTNTYNKLSQNSFPKPMQGSYQPSGIAPVQRMPDGRPNFNQQAPNNFNGNRNNNLPQYGSGYF